MTIDRYAEERIRSWLLSVAPDRMPDHVLPTTFERTRRLAQTSRRRRWVFRSMRLLPFAFAAGALAIALVAVNLPFAGQELPPGAVNFSLTSTISGQWTSASETAFTVQRDPADNRTYYWRAAIYDRVDMDTWRTSNDTTTTRPRDARLLEGLADDVDEIGRHSVTFTVMPGLFRGATVLSPATPVSVNQDVELTTVGQDGFFASVRRAGDGAYRVTALVAEIGAGDGMLNVSTLRGAGMDYSPELVDLYTAQSEAVLGPNVTALRDEIVATAESTAPYDIAARLVEVLRGPDYTYDTDVRDLDCASISIAECFATFKRGYCQYYATTMAVVLRDLGIPARLVEGFLPGQRDPGTGTELVPMSNAHAWVEVYFPGYGWVAFDPTGGGVAQLPAELPSGPPIEN